MGTLYSTLKQFLANICGKEAALPASLNVLLLESFTGWHSFGALVFT